ncbi:MAG: Hpt domain-containing protein [Ghiorsea sp.]|nr:Hpt domain-containing protein [Ghiorsea sp.]
MVQKEPNRPYIDTELLDELASIYKHDHDLDSLIAKFIVATHLNISKLNQALTEADKPCYIQVFHALKGSSGIVGATQVYDICVLVEHHQHLGTDMMQQYLDQLKIVFCNTEGALTDYLQKRLLHREQHG